MNDIICVQLLSWGVFSGVLLVLSLLFAGRLCRLCLRGLSGASLIFIANCLLYKTGVFLALNFVTVLFSAVMGVPGIALMYGFLFLLK